MATGSEPSIHMKSSDLIKKEALDYGGFGEIYLCYHKTLGRVVLKTVYTGPHRNESNRRSLLEESRLMSKLNHQRIVKLLGVILEDGAYSLVMELIPKGNLLTMLKKVSVPISIKGRIILETLEGMVYLTNKKVIHKDLKPENILVDEQFHAKIADLGLATCQTWSKLTKDESRRLSSLGRRSESRGGGTLSYMAPEHLSSIHSRSTEKSDIYSFAIVVWVILAGQEPYENALNDDQLCTCVRLGDRPDMSIIPENTPSEMISLMKQCWDHEPQKRPTFGESHDMFRTFYQETLEGDVETDLDGLMKLYKGPEELLEKLKSMSMESSISTDLSPAPSCPHPSDSPAPLQSSEMAPMEASIEDLGLLISQSSVQEDAGPMTPVTPATPVTPVTPETPATSEDLKQKLGMELNYHMGGSYGANQPDLLHHSVGHGNHLNRSISQQNSPSPGEFHYQPSSSVQSWTKPEFPPSPAAEEASRSHSALGKQSQAFPSSVYPRQFSGPSPQNQYPGNLGSPEFATPEYGLSMLSPYPSQGALVIQHARGIQIGNSNSMYIRHPENRSPSPQSHGCSPNTKYKELLQKYEDHAVADDHLAVLRHSIGAQWKQCARSLGLSEVEVEAIEHDYTRDGLMEMVHQMFEKWRMKEGCLGSTVGRLCGSLEACVKQEVLYRVLLKCSDATIP